MSKRSEKVESDASEMLQAMLLPIARVMIHNGRGAGELIEAVKAAYVQAAKAEVTPGGERTNISRIAVVTGLTRKEVAAILSRADPSKPTPSSKKAVTQRAFRVLQGWRMDPLFQRADGRPASLPLRGERRSFAALVKKYGSDVTPVSVLRELQRMEAVSTTRSGNIRYLAQTTRSQTHAAQHMAEFAGFLKDFIHTVQQGARRDPPAFFGFKDATVDTPVQAALFQRAFSKRADSLLESVDQWMGHQKTEPDRQRRTAGKTRVGLGVYLVEEEMGGLK